MDADDPEADSASVHTRSRPWRAKPRDTRRVFEEAFARRRRGHRARSSFRRGKTVAEEHQRKYGTRGLGSNAARYEEAKLALDEDGMFVYEVLSMIALTKDLKAK